MVMVRIDVFIWIEYFYSVNLSYLIVLFLFPPLGFCALTYFVNFSLLLIVLLSYFLYIMSAQYRLSKNPFIWAASQLLANTNEENSMLHDRSIVDVHVSVIMLIHHIKRHIGFSPSLKPFREFLILDTNCWYYLTPFQDGGEHSQFLKTRMLRVWNS